MPDNPYFPYNKVGDYATLPDAETLLKKVVDYLLDFPMKGYTPPSDTRTPRSRLIRLLYYDVPHPLDQPLPTPEQKISIVFDPESPDVPPDTDKGYRVYPMIYPIQAESMGRTTLKIFMSYAKPQNPMRVEQRIGRVDRLGQKYKEIRIINLHYKDTVEADVYNALTRNNRTIINKRNVF